MPIDETRPFQPVRIAVLTVSDTRGPADDRSGDTLVALLTQAGHALAARDIVRDDADLIVERLNAWIDDPLVDCVISTGGTGVTGRDVTPEAFARALAAEVAHHGGIAVCSPIAPEDEVRRQVAERVRERGGRFVLVHVATPLEECERRDRKGLYAAARRGDIPDFTGISAPYDVPADPDLRLDTTGRDVAGCADEVLALLRPTDGTHRA